MAQLIGISDIGTWVSKRYIDRYGLDTKWMKQFVGKLVMIRTNQGLWRPGAQGYTSSPADAGKYEFDVAWDLIKDLGPEKYAGLIVPGKPAVRGKKKHRWIVEVKATITIEAMDHVDAAMQAELLSAPLTVPDGVVTTSVPQLEN